MPASRGRGWGGANLARIHCGSWLRRLGPLRHDPQFEVILLAKTTINTDQPTGIDSALAHQAISSTCDEAIRLLQAAGAPTVDNHVSLGPRVVLQLDREVIKTSLFVERD